MEAVTHHALGEQEKDDCEDDYKQETSNSETRWLSSCNVRHTSEVYHEPVRGFAPAYDFSASRF